MIEVLLAAVMAGAISAPQMQGNRLQPGTTCYGIFAGSEQIGSTLQIVKRSSEGSRPTWDIVIHQKAVGPKFGRFDMRDHFVVDRSTLLPLRMESKSGDEGVDRGWHRVELTYGPNAVRGTKRNSSGSEAINVSLSGPVWDGNLWGIMFAALPLRKGRNFVVPFWQYDKGFGTFNVRTIGSDDAVTPSGKVSAWVVEAGTGPGPASRYTIRKGPRLELGYERGGMGQRLGGSCE